MNTDILNIKRKRRSQAITFGLFRVLSYMVILILLVILGFIIYNGAGSISWNFLTGYPEDGMTKGGIFPAIVGTICLIIGSMVFAFPIGIMSGIYINEYAGNNWIVKFIRIMTNNPKKIIGLEGYGLEVVDRLPIEIPGEEENRKYLRTKRDKMGHILELYGEMPMGCVTRDP